ncbi:MAG: transposase [Bdellovibrionales bacterium]|nr:transposase [Bdellovibrionales bacterium]
MPFVNACRARTQIANKISTRTPYLSEGINNVIKTMKRKAYGYRNMGYFRLEIMQVCGYLNSRYCSM